jgi:hypothetical protein
MIHPPLTKQSDEAFCITARKLHKRTQSSNPHEADTAEQMLRAHLKKRGIVWDDLAEVLSKTDMDDKWIDEDPVEALRKCNLIDLIMDLFAMYAGMVGQAGLDYDKAHGKQHSKKRLEEADEEADEYLAATLWILHTYVFDYFTYTPRLAALSPPGVYGCGKTVLLRLLAMLCHDSYPRFLSSSAAGLYHLMDEGPGRTIPMDEGNNQHLLEDKTLRSILNANCYGDNVLRATGRRHSAKFHQTFSPLAIAAAGKLPDDLYQRCIVFNMHKRPEDAPPLKVLDEREPSFLMLVGVIKERIEEWRREADLNRHPDSPVKNRYADNWRPLLSIADSLGYGEKARKLALQMTAGLPDDAASVYLLRDIRIVFNKLGVDRIFTSVLLEELYKLEGTPWSEWTGINNDRNPHPMTATEMSQMLRGFGITPKTVAQLGSRGSRGPTAQGYWRKWFERAWASYCPETERQPVELRVIDSSKS